MKRPLAVLLALLCFACAPTTSLSTAGAPPARTTPAAVSALIPPPLPPAPPIGADTMPGTPPKNWQLLDEATDHIAGISSQRAMRELVTGKQAVPIVVAVIDGGVDTAQIDLKANLWVNPGNTANDDRYGYRGDVHGWNFIGGRDGRDIDEDTYEVTRLFAGCRNRAPGHNLDSLPAADKVRCDKIAADFDKQKADAEAELPNIQGADKALTQVTQILQQAASSDSLNDSIVARLAATSPLIKQAKSMYVDLAKQGITRSAIDGALKDVESRLKYGLNPDYNPRSTVGDDTTNINQRDYGNPDVTGPDADHGTHVSGIIGAVRDNGIGIDGIAPAVRIMAVRAVPNGDERDKDIANAIRYAVDNGARVINMSFGKPYSPGKSAVDEAVKYADAHGVLMVHASGNDGANADSVPSFPNPYYLDGGHADNWIEVGASSWKGGDSLAASFSNFGHAHVDLFAPGVDILSTIPGNKYDRYSGTSMASPVVAGVAALVMSYYPTLTAAQVKAILLNSATRHPDQLVARPGSDGVRVPFGQLSATGGIVNAYNALRMAAEVAGAKK